MYQHKCPMVCDQTPPLVVIVLQLICLESADILIRISGQQHKGHLWEIVGILKSGMKGMNKLFSGSNFCTRGAAKSEVSLVNPVVEFILTTNICLLAISWLCKKRCSTQALPVPLRGILPAYDVAEGLVSAPPGQPLLCSHRAHICLAEGHHSCIALSQPTEADKACPALKGWLQQIFAAGERDWWPLHDTEVIKVLVIGKCKT